MSNDKQKVKINPRSLYNVAAGLVDETIIGPYLFSAKIKVLGLAADKTKLKAYLDHYMNRTLSGTNIEFTLAQESIVYLVIADLDDLEDGAKTGLFENRSCHFHIPVQCWEDDKEPVNGSVQVFSFSSRMQNVITSAEVRGPAMTHAVMNFKEKWFEDIDVKGEFNNPIFDVNPLLAGKDGQLTSKRLMSIIVREPESDDLENPGDPGKAGKSPAAPPLGGWSPADVSTVFALKQIPHTETVKACFQSLVKIAHEMKKDSKSANILTAPPNEWITDYWQEGSLFPDFPPMPSIFGLELPSLESINSVEELKQNIEWIKSKVNVIKIAAGNLTAEQKDHPVIKTLLDVIATKRLDDIPKIFEGRDKLRHIAVRINRHAGHPIVDALNLTPESFESNGTKALLRPILYVAIDTRKYEEKGKTKIKFKECLGETVCYRTENTGDHNGWSKESLKEKLEQLVEVEVEEPSERAAGEPDKD